MNNLIETTLAYSAANIITQPLAISHGKGCYLYDFEGNSYLDLMTGIAVVNLGHGHPRLLDTLNKQAQKLAILPRLLHHEPLAQLLQLSCTLSGMDKAIPMNSGAEAVETAIKVARKWAYTQKNVAADQAEVIVCKDNFHGRTITTISMSSTEAYKANFGPLTPNFILIPYNDPEALAAAITPNTAALIVEPIQGEAGVVIPDPDYLSACEALCKKNKVLLIVDEIQTGIGRTGTFLAYQQANIHPDGVLLGKALGGGLLPISLFLAKNEVMKVIQPGDHGSTFGGNPLAAAVAYETLQIVIEEDLCAQAGARGHYFVDKLKAIKSPLIQEVRGSGLLIGVEINTQRIPSSQVFSELLKNGLITINTRNKIIRLLPPLTINKEQIDDAVNIIAVTLQQLEEPDHAKIAS